MISSHNVRMGPKNADATFGGMLVLPDLASTLFLSNHKGLKVGNIP